MFLLLFSAVPQRQTHNRWVSDAYSFHMVWLRMLGCTAITPAT